MIKPRCMITVDVEAMPMRAGSNHVDTLIYGKVGGGEYGIGKIMDIADKHNVEVTFFLDFAECELYGDEIINVGKYIVSRGHDLQVHCHYDLLKDVVGKEPWGSNENYYSWYKNDNDAKIMIDYVTEQYVRCTGKMPAAYRGGEYRFDIPILKVLKEKGYQADLSYNCIRPLILTANKQFLFENGLIELPIGILPDKKPLNFNYAALEPKALEDFDRTIGEYNKLFDEYYEYYGRDAIATVLMHSWSFLHNDEPSPSGFFDKPNDTLVSFFDRFIEALKDKVEFISVSEALRQISSETLKTADFRSVFCDNSPLARKNLMKVSDFVNEQANGRQIVIWGKGWLESTVFQAVNLHNSMDAAYYISNDADIRPQWRGKPVYKYSDVNISPENNFVLLLAQPTFSEIRDTLHQLGFKKFMDYYDIQELVPENQTNGVQSRLSYNCPICGGNIFETYDSSIPRKCSSCKSVERSRTITNLLNENIHIDFTKTKILHISPTIPERLFFKNMGANTVSVDIRPECKTDIIADICNMPNIESESFDMVFANCVLNHVYDDERALAEISRVLRLGGTALIFVIGSKTLKTTESKDPTGWYGKENYEKYKIGTFRYYGETDFTKQLGRHFSDVKCYEKYDIITDSSCKWYCCRKGYDL
ncbi:MAG: methyltransferase domain-containing protein [Lachnospiraceae bacterium]